MNMLWKTNKISYYLWFTGSVVTSIACSFTVFRVLQSQSKFPRPLTGQMFLFKKIILLFILVHMYGMYICMHICIYARLYVGMHVPWHKSGSQMATCRNQFFPFTLWIPGVELKFPGLAVSALTHWASSRPGHIALYGTESRFASERSSCCFSNLQYTFPTQMWRLEWFSLCQK